MQLMAKKKKTRRRLDPAEQHENALVAMQHACEALQDAREALRDCPSAVAQLKAIEAALEHADEATATLEILVENPELAEMA